MRRELATLIAALALPALAQHHAAPYAGQQARSIKALSEKEVADLMSGAGMGFAKAAELNRYPGPMHALEHAEALALTPTQREALASLMASHKAEARTIGALVVEGERELDALFASRRADPASIDAALARIAEATAQLRGAHLKTHLEATRVLTPAQVERYVRLRGYAESAGPGSPAEPHRHAH